MYLQSAIDLMQQVGCNSVEGVEFILLMLWPNLLAIAGFGS